jgi:hypothetical protein
MSKLFLTVLDVFGNSKIQKMAKKNTKVQSIKIFSHLIRACCFL